MSKRFSYTVKDGDTVQDLSTRFYGVPSDYPKIVNANPSISKNNLQISAGQILIIPRKIPLNLQRNETDDLTNTVVIDIDGKIFEDFWGFKLKLSIEKAADVFSFQLPWNPENENLKNTFLPFQYKDIEIRIGGVLQFTGTIVNIVPEVTTERRTLKVSGYSTCGILNDCNLPTSAYPLEFQNATFFDICKALTTPFEIEVTDAVGDNFQFEEVDIKPTDKVYGFLAKLAKKRGLLITSDIEGNLIIQKSTEETADFTFKEGEPDILAIGAKYDGQSGFTTFTGLVDAEDTLDPIGDDSHEIKDEFMSQVSSARPFVFEIDEIDEGNLIGATEAMLRRSWAKRISYSLTLKGWRDPDDNLWRDNKRINVEYPGVMIYNVTEFLITDIELIKDESKNVTKMTLVLPQSYSDEELEGLPWLQE